MRIAMLSTPHVPTPPKGYGASELIAGQLVEELVRRGHFVRLFATDGSSPHASELRNFPASRNGATFEQRELTHAAYALREVADCDIVHNHCVTAGPPLARLCSVPFFTTLHYSNPSVAAFPDGPYVAVSQDQRNRLASINVAATVYNGINLAEFPLVTHKDDYLLFLGRFHPNKGPDLAIDVAERLGYRLVIAAPAPPDDKRAWFQDVIEPRLRGRIEWVGPVEGDQKSRLLGRARATLVPIRWDEPFGLVIAESMACGTPPIAFRRGAAPEIIEDGVNGWLVADVDAMAAAVGRCAELSPAACRRRIAERFTVARMVEGYLAVYHSLINSFANRTNTKLGTGTPSS
jgi:glycosyltransferase involved in cell wall biosynthesis